MFDLDHRAGWADVRSRFRSAVRQHHPDVSTAPDAAAATARLNEAYLTLSRSRGRLPLGPVPGATASASSTDDSAPVVGPTDDSVPVVGPTDDSVLVVAPKEDVFWGLHRACDQVGDITYADPDGGLLEARIPAPDGSLGADASTLLITLQGRASGTEAFFTLESPDAERAPSLPDLVRQIARLISPDPPRS